jgi:hypothetical protein
MDINFIKNIGLVLLALLLILGGIFFLISGQLHLAPTSVVMVQSGLAILAVAAGGFILLGK